MHVWKSKIKLSVIIHSVLMSASQDKKSEITFCQNRYKSREMRSREAGLLKLLTSLIK